MLLLPWLLEPAMPAPKIVRCEPKLRSAAKAGDGS
jgi:hypothetical protein